VITKEKCLNLPGGDRIGVGAWKL